VSGAEKIRQMISASVRAYQGGPDTTEARQRIVRDYLNSVPLSAVPGHGEVHGMAEGLRGTAPISTRSTKHSFHRQRREEPGRRGLALRQVLSLMIAQRRPSHYLSKGRLELAELTDAHIRVLAANGIVERPLADAALASKAVYRDWVAQPTIVPIITNKGISLARNRLAAMLNRPLYDLDRLDLSATSTLQADLNMQVSQYLKNLADPAFAAQMGLIGERLLTSKTTDQVSYSFTLFERTGDGSRVRVQTDSTNQPFDINEGSKLELGSTAKLRVLTTYLEIIAELHDKYAGKPPAELKKVPVAELDRISQWSLEWLMQNQKNQSLMPCSTRPLERKYSANTGEAFLHRRRHARVQQLPQGRQQPQPDAQGCPARVDQPAVHPPDARPGALRHLPAAVQPRTAAKDDSDPRRQEYLARFADREGSNYLMRFWKKYQRKTSQQRLDTFLDSMRVTPQRLAAVHRYLFPNPARKPSTPSWAHSKDDKIAWASSPTAAWWKCTRLTARASTTCPTRVHRQGPPAGPVDARLPAEEPRLDVQGHRQRQPFERQEVYSWLFKSRTRAPVTAASAPWSRSRRSSTSTSAGSAGYPFDHLVPSLATAIGSSGDRPAALSELIGIIQNDGVRLPTLRIDTLHFAAGTPYETKLLSDPDRRQADHAGRSGAALKAPCRRWWMPVPHGAGSFKLHDGTPLVMGGKTGTGDNRIESFGAGGRLIGSRSLNRTATFVFFLGDNHFGTSPPSCRGAGRSLHLHLGTAGAGAQGHGADPHAVPATGNPNACKPPQVPLQPAQRNTIDELDDNHLHLKACL
jgi:membrane peptidoglycan carboxypeptidase